MSARRSGDERGASLVLAMGAVALLGVFATSTLAFAGVGARQGAVSEARTEQLYAADAGMEYGIRGLAADPSICSRGGATHTWPPVQLNGRTVTYRCEWVSGTGAPGSPRTARVVSRASGPGDIEVTTAAAIVRPDGTPTVMGWETHGDWQSPGPSTTTSTVAPPTTTTLPSTTTTMTTSTTVPPGPPRFPGALWLKTSGPGNVWSSPNLPLAATVPTAWFLPNYDRDRDLMPGLVIERGPGKADEKKEERHQDWLLPVPVPTRLAGNVRLVLFSTTPYFIPGRRGRVEVFLADCDGSGESCTTMASDAVERPSWNGGQWDLEWVPTTFELGRLDTTIVAQRTLKLTVTVDNRSSDDLWFAYDTVGEASRLLIE